MEEKHKEIYIKAVYKSLNDVLGSTTTQIIFVYLEERCKIKKEEIPSKMKEFRNQLQQILGTAAKTIEEEIQQNIENGLETTLKGESMIARSGGLKIQSHKEHAQ